MLRLLLSAYACEPEKGSEPGVGWNWVRQAARFHEVWVITRENNRQPIEKARGTQGLLNVHFVYFDLPSWARFWKTGQRRIHLYYYLWQIGAYFLGKKLHQKIGFDAIHHVTFVNCWMPSFLALLPAPFVWGPVGGGESAPRGFWRSFSFKGRVHEILRDVVRGWGRLDPFVRLTARRAELALATTRETEQMLQTLGCRRIAVLSQVGLPADEIQRLGTLAQPENAVFRVLSLGRLLHWKGFALGLKAFAEFHRMNPASEYWLIGDGPERKRLEELARQLGVAQSVVFRGSMERPQAIEKLAECDVLLHPSLHDSGAWVCLEAMAVGRPVICLDLAGPALQVTSETGIKIPAISPKQVIHDLAAALTRLSADAALRARMGSEGRRRARQCFTWESKGDLWSEPSTATASVC